MNHNHLNGLNLDITVRNKTPHKRVFLFCHKMNVFDCFWQFMIENVSVLIIIMIEMG